MTRKTDRGIPRYLDDSSSDVFVLSGAEDLVPARRKDGSLDALELEGFDVQRYRPRTEGLFARVERWTSRAGGDVHWRAITRDNVLTVYGRSREARITDPDVPARVFSWLVEETRDDRGNVARYTYKAEDGSGVDPGRPSESHRFDGPAGARVFRATAQRYLKRIQYGNRTPVQSRDADAPAGDGDYLFEVVFDYGEHDPRTPAPRDDEDADRGRSWTLRPDPFSTYRAGFEVRTYRRCERVLMFHRFPELGPEPCLVRSTDFTYGPRPGATDPKWPAVTYLTEATQAGYRRAGGGSEYDRAALPPLALGYVKPADVFNDALKSIDAESLKGIATGVEGSGGHWVDLDGEGLPGILLAADRAWYYKANLGGGRLAAPQLEATLPAPADLAGGAQQLVDLGGDGNLDLVRYAPPLSGWFERTPDRGWAPHRPLERVPNLDWGDPNLRFIDVDGDGLADVLVTEQDAFVWYRSRGKDGFDPAAFAPRPRDDRSGVAVAFTSGAEIIQLADMSGDGLVDLVRVRNGEVCYWPNLGHGSFGRKVTLDVSSGFEDAQDEFDPKRVRLADVDGSGTSDVIYLGRDGVRIYFNQSGNGLCDAVRVTSLPQIDSASSVSVVDLLGRGTACLVWSTVSAAGEGRPVHYVDLMSSRKPHLLASIDNNFGAETRIGWSASTQFYLSDKEAGRPWITRLAFPVHVVERIERIDRIARSRLVTRFAYHHGHFDGDEREFCGFAWVEQWDAESFSAAKGSGLFPELSLDADPPDLDLNVPPVRTETWFHTGAWLGRQQLGQELARSYYRGDPQAPLLPDAPPLQGLSLREEREAARALRGRILRQEIYGEDSSDAAVHPYSVSERSYAVQLIQPAVDGSHGVFFVHPSETVTLHYERRPADPRVEHEVVLDVDDFGQVTQAATLAYPRRERVPDSTDAQAPELDEQRRVWATLVERQFANRPDEAGWYRTGVPVSTTRSELTGLELGDGGLVDREELRGAALAEALPFDATPPDVGAAKRVVDREDRFYYGDHASAGEHRADEQGLRLGDITERALLHHVERLAFTPSFVSRVYGAEIDDAALLRAKYVQRSGSWWAPSGRAVYDPGQFFLTIEVVDPFGSWTGFDYDVHALLPVAAKEPRVEGDGGSGDVDLDPRFGSVTRAEQDYCVLAPKTLTDSNYDVTGARYGALGLPEEIRRVPGPGKRGGDQKAASVHFRYGFDAWRNDRKPVWSHTARRIEHDAGGAPFAIENGVERLDRPTRPGWLHSRVHSDGSGREVLTKVTAEPGPVPSFDSPGHLKRRPDGTPETHEVQDRWVGTGRTVFDNKGNAVKKYEPYFWAGAGYEDEPELVEVGVTSMFRHDPIGRLVRTDLPNGTFARVDLDAWETRTWDENDTVRESAWYARRGSPDPSSPEPTKDPTRRAAWLAAKHAGTFTTAHLDPLGRPFLNVTDNGSAGKNETRFELDVNGELRGLTDARGVRALRQDFDALRRKLRVMSSDAGETRTLLDIFDAPVRSRDPRGFVLRREYDALRRTTHLFVTTPTGETSLAECTRYGEQHASAAAGSLRGRAHQLLDGAGLLTVRFDFKGNVEHSQRRLVRDHRAAIDWTPRAGLGAALGPFQEAEPLLSDESFDLVVTHDALDRVTSRTTPDAKVTTLAYNDANLLEQLAVDGEQFVAGADYNARGQVLTIKLGNGIRTSYTYDDQTFRLVRQVSTRSTTGEVWQDLRYEYDPAGNVTQIADGVSFGRPAHLPTVPADGDLNLRLAAVYGDRAFRYDATYQLVEARARHRTAGRASPEDAPIASFVHPKDPQGVESCVEGFDYDAVGNILRMSCVPFRGVGAGWARPYEYAPRSNRLVRTGMPGDPDGTLSAAYQHDLAGNITRMPHLPRLRWDHANRLAGVQRQVQPGPSRPNDVFFAYDSSGKRVHKACEHDGVLEERIYLDGWEVFRRRKAGSGAIEHERKTLHVMIGGRRVALIEAETVDGGVPCTDQPRIRFQLQDHLSSSLMELDHTGRPFSYEEYYAYGETSFRACRGAFSTSAKRYRYSGKERDEETALYYYGARYCAAWLGRWTGCDPAGFAGGTCLYRYSFNSPLSYGDPTGRAPEDRVRAAQAMIGTPYEQESDSKLRTGATPDALAYMDCAEFVSRVLAADKLTSAVLHLNSSGIKALLDDATRFTHSQDHPLVGDIAVWEGHVGVVTGVEGDNIKLTHARGRGKLAAENSTAIAPEQYRPGSTFYGYYRPRSETGGSTAQPQQVATSRDAGPASSATHPGSSSPEVRASSSTSSRPATSGSRCVGPTWSSTGEEQSFAHVVYGTAGANIMEFRLRSPAGTRISDVREDYSNIPSIFDSSRSGGDAPARVIASAGTANDQIRLYELRTSLVLLLPTPNLRLCYAYGP